MNKRVGRPDLPLAIDHRRQRAHVDLLTAAPFGGGPRPFLRQLDEDVFEAGAADLEAQHAPALCQRADDGEDPAVVFLQRSSRRCYAVIDKRIGCRAASSSSMPGGSRSKVTVDVAYAAATAA